MVKTNKENLLEVALVGEVTHTSMHPSYTTTWDNQPLLGVGRGGIVYNVKVGDPCFGWAWGEGGARGIRGRSRQRPGEGLLQEPLSRAFSVTGSVTEDLS